MIETRTQAYEARSAYFKSIGVPMTETGEKNMTAWDEVVRAVLKCN